MDAEGINGVLSWRACDHEGCRRFVAVKKEKTTLVVNAKQYAMMRAKQEKAYQELQEAINYMNESQRNLLAMMERKQKLMGEAPEDLRGKIFQAIRDLDERISFEEIDLLEKKQVMEEMLKGRRSTDVGEVRDTVIVVSGVTRMAVAGSRRSKTQGDLSPFVRSEKTKAWCSPSCFQDPCPSCFSAWLVPLSLPIAALSRASREHFKGSRHVTDTSCGTQ